MRFAPLLPNLYPEQQAQKDAGKLVTVPGGYKKIHDFSPDNPPGGCSLCT